MTTRRIGLWSLALLLCAGIGATEGVAQQPEDRKAAAQQLFVRGLTQAYLNNHEEALALYQQALTLIPNEATLLSAVAQTQETLENMPVAVFYAEQARHYAPDNVHYHRHLSQLYQRSGDLNAALQAYETLLNHFPDNVQALQELASLQGMMGRTGEAIATYERLIERAGDRPALRRQVLHLYFRLGDEEGTRRSLDALTRLEPGNPAPYRLLGQLYLQQHKEGEALEAFERAYEVDPDNLETILALTDLYREVGRTADADRLSEQAINVETASVDELVVRATPLFERAATDTEAAETADRLLQQVLDAAPDQPDALLMLGTLRYQAGAYVQAASLLERALEHHPRDLALWRRAVAAHGEAGHFADAARIAEEGLLLFPGHLSLLRMAAFNLLEMRRDNDAFRYLEEAFTILVEEIPDTMEHASLLATRGRLHTRRGDYTRAEADFRQALTLEPGNAPTLNAYAYSLAERETRLEEARTMAQRAVDQEPQKTAYLGTLGWVFYKLEQYTEAKRWLGKAVETGQNHAGVFAHYGDVHERLGDGDTALHYWRKALELTPDDPALQEKLRQP